MIHKNWDINYITQIRKTKDAIDEGGWYKTGDLAVMRKSGHVQIVGRSKDMIIRGGENIYPAEVEAFLFTHPNVKEAHIIGVPDHRLGEQVGACNKYFYTTDFYICILILK